MNRIYRLVFNHSLGLFQVASETARAHGKSGSNRSPRGRRLVLAVAMTMAMPALATVPGIVGAPGSVGSDANTVGVIGGNGGNGDIAVTNPATALTSGTNNSNVLGGAGGRGGLGGYGADQTGDSTSTGALGGNGGNGAAGIASDNFTLTNDSVIKGGVGGVGGVGGSGGLGISSTYVVDGLEGIGGTGGTGGTGGNGGVAIAGVGFTLTNTGTVFGGSGGNGGQGGTGGQGGDGVDSHTDYKGGGHGGDGGAGGVGGLGGNGATAVSGSEFLLINRGTVQGGDGGSAGAGGATGVGGQGGLGYAGGPSPTPDGQPGEPGAAGDAGSWGQAGVAVISTGSSVIINSGIIKGGVSGSGSSQTQANAIELSGGNNILELQSGSDIQGNVVSTSGSSNGGDTLRLGGDADDTFDVSQIGTGYQGFAHYAKAGDSTWTLTGDATGQTTSWNVQGGTLSISSDDSLGDSSSTLTLDGGTLKTTNSAIYINHDITLGSHGGTLDNGNTGLSINGVISGVGGLTLTGSGTTRLYNYNTYEGATSVTAGRLLAGGNHVLSANSAVSVSSGATLDLNGYAQTIGSLAGAGNVTLGSATLNTGGDNTDTTFSGVIEGTGALVKEGTGNMTLSGTNTYSGGTLVEGGGSLTVSSDANLGNASGNITLTGSKLVIAADDFSSARNITLHAVENMDDVQYGTIDNGGHNAAFSGVISGDSLIIEGSGVTTLSGTNTYGGGPDQGTGVLNSTLAVASDANLGAASGVVVLQGGTLKTTQDFTTNRSIMLSAGTQSNALDNGSHNALFSGAISGNGGLTIQGGGTTTFTGSKTYGGLTTIAGNSTLRANAAYTFSSVSGIQVNAGSILNLNNYNQNIGSLAGTGNVTLGSAILNMGQDNTDAIFAGVISGTGSIVKSGTGTQTLSGVNTYTGNTTIYNGGTLAINSDASLGGANGDVHLSGGSLRTVANVNSARNITLFSSEGGQPPLYSRLDNGGNDSTFSGVISGGGSLELSGSGTTTLSAVNTYTGFTRVNAGTLRLTDGAKLASSAITVNSGAALSAGNASVNALANAGTVTLDAGKTLSVAGNFTNTGTLATSLASSAASSVNHGKIVVDGTATLGGTLKINIANNTPLTAGSLASVLHANSIVNRFDAVTSESLLFSFGATYTDTDVGVTITSKRGLIESVVADHRNNTALPAARVLGRIIDNDATSALSLRFAGLTNDHDANNAVTQSLPLLAGGSQAAANAAQSGINQVVQGRLDASQGLSSGDGFLTDNHLWLKPFGSWADQGDRNGVSGYDASVGGLAIGTDGKLSDKTLLGVSFAYANASVDSNSNVAPNKVDVDVYQLVGYGSHSLDNATTIDFQLGAGVNKNQGKRELSLFDLTAKADYSSVTAIAGLGIGHTFTLNEQLRFTPSVRADYTWIKDKGYTEDGADVLNLKVKSRDTDSLILAVDGKLNYAFNAATSVSANLGAGYDTLNDRASITSAYAGAPGAAFTTEGLDLDPWLLRAGVGLTHVVDNGTEVSLRYDAEKRNDFFNQTASVKVRWAF